ncbi:hypothetical protein RIF29_13264 [Crotalaria pallida]|uniref:Uncharacterized protein n=1 Tax=Crotalaria pallida TaxID=3830 RepID=A0AAN9P1S6_CROPI
MLAGILLLMAVLYSIEDVRVSNTLGMSHPKATKYSFFVAMFQSLLLGILFLTVIFLCKDDIAIIFSNSKDMIKAVSDLAYLLGLTMVLVSASLVISGVAIGCGWQVMVAYINLASYYIVGIPLGVYLGFKQHFGVKGLWGGTMCGNVLQIIVLMLIIWQTNWIKEVEQTADRMRSWSSKNLSKDMLEDGT